LAGGRASFDPGQASSATAIRRARKPRALQPGGEAIHDALFRAYFVDGKSIGDPQILIQVAKTLGLDEGRRASTASPGCRPTSLATAV
jgi:predicted DsbA family dithiol-disulfide isomerase